MLSSRGITVLSALALALAMGILQPSQAVALQQGVVVYSGSHSAGGAVTFTTDGFTILSLTVTRTPGGDCFWDTIELDNWSGRIEIKNNGFLATNEYGDEFSGQFSRGLQASGRFRSVDPSTPNCDSGFLTWQATGTPSAAPTPTPRPPGPPSNVAPVPAPAMAPPAPRIAEQAAGSIESCQSGDRIVFAPGLDRLRSRIGDVMGDPATCPDVNLANNDVLQPTTRGLSYVRWHSELVVFTDGWRHWAIDRSGKEYFWEGESPDPE